MKQGLTMYAALKERDKTQLETATVVVCGNGTIDIKLANGTVIPHVPCGSQLQVGSSVFVQFIKGRAVVFGGQPQSVSSEGNTYVTNTYSSGGGGGGSLTAHALSDTAIHTGTLADTQAPQFLKTDGSRQLTGNMAVSAGVTIDGVDLSVFKSENFLTHSTMTDLPNGRILTAGQLITTSNAVAGQLVVQVDPNKLTIAGKLVQTGVGVLTLAATANYSIDFVATGTAALGAQTVTVTSTNDVSTSSHSHAIDSSSNPAASRKILATDASGLISLAGLGIGVYPPTSPIQIRNTLPQIRLEYDSSTNGYIGVDSGGNIVLTAMGDIVINPSGYEFLPQINHAVSLGSQFKKFLAIHADELVVETLVAAEKRATTGGAIAVGPTTKLIADVPAVSTGSPATLISTTQSYNTQVSSISISLPSSGANGDYLLIHVSLGDTALTASISGFTQLGSTVVSSDNKSTSMLFQKLISTIGSEPASYTVTLTGTAKFVVVKAYLIRGMTAFEAVAGTSGTSTTNNAQGPLTSGGTNRLLLFFGNSVITNNSGNSFTVPSGMTAGFQQLVPYTSSGSVGSTPTVQTITSIDGTDVTSLSTTLPSGLANNDYLVLHVAIGIYSTALGINTPSGYTAYDNYSPSNKVRHAVFYKKVTNAGTETAPSVTFTGMAYYAIAKLFIVRGANQTTFINASASSVASEDASAANTLTGHNQPLLTTTQNNSLILSFNTTERSATTAALVTAPAGYSENYESGKEYGGYTLGIEMSSIAQATAGGSGTPTIGLSPSGYSHLTTVLAVNATTTGGTTDELTEYVAFQTVGSGTTGTKTAVAAKTGSVSGHIVLIQPVAGGTSTIDVEHNNIRPGDIVMLMARGKVEFMSASSDYSIITGGYRYSVTRDLDGTGANDWLAGDAVFNTGQVGSTGFIDLYSQHSFKGYGIEYVFNVSSAGVFSQNLSELNSISLFADIPANITTNTAMYYGMSNGKWENVYFYLTQGLAGTGITTAYQYWNGSAWTTIPSIGFVGNVTSANTFALKWTKENLTGWTPNTVNGISAYWVRWVITSGTGTQSPKTGYRRMYRGEPNYGPTMVGWVRTANTARGTVEAFAAGNLNGLYAYGVDTFGFAAGFLTGSWVSVDSTNGFRVMSTTQRMGWWKTNGDIELGVAANVKINANGTFSFTGDANNVISWNGTTLTVKGDIQVVSGNAVTVTDYYRQTSAPATAKEGAWWFDTDDNILYQRISGSWVVVARNYTNTNQLTDGANLGGTAVWTSVSGRPGIAVSGQITTAATPSGSGLFLGSDNMGYYSGGAWRTYMNSSGQFFFVGASGASLNWNGFGLYGSNSSAVVQWYTDSTTGAIVAGGGQVLLNANGITVGQSTTVGGDYTYGGAIKIGGSVITASRIGTPAADTLYINSDYTEIGNSTVGTYLSIGSATEGLNPSTNKFIRFYIANAVKVEYNITDATLSVVGGITNTGNITTNSAVFASNWFRSYGSTGWYNETYGGGMYMVDGTWIRAYNSKSIYSDQVVRGDGGLVSGEITPTTHQKLAVGSVSNGYFTHVSLAISTGNGTSWINVSTGSVFYRLKVMGSWVIPSVGAVDVDAYVQTGVDTLLGTISGSYTLRMYTDSGGISVRSGAGNWNGIVSLAIVTT